MAVSKNTISERIKSSGFSPLQVEASAAPSADADVADEGTRTDSDPAAAVREQRVTVSKGDSLYLIFRRLGIPPTDLANLLDSGKDASGLRRLRPGQELTVGLREDNGLANLRVELDETRTLRARRTEQGFDTRIEHTPLERHVVNATAVIENSLFLNASASSCV